MHNTNRPMLAQKKGTTVFKNCTKTEIRTLLKRAGIQQSWRYKLNYRNKNIETEPRLRDEYVTQIRSVIKPKGVQAIQKKYYFIPNIITGYSGCLITGINLKFK